MKIIISNKYLLFISLFFISIHAFSQENQTSEMMKYYSKMTEQKELDSIQLTYDRFLEVYPEEKYPDLHYIYSLAKSVLIVAMIKRDVTGWESLLASIPHSQMRRNTISSVSGQLFKKDKAGEAATILRQELELPMNDSLDLAAYSYAYGDLMYKMGRYEEALRMLEPLAEQKGLKYFQQEELFAAVLYENKHYERAFAILDSLLRKGMAGENSKKIIKELWQDMGKSGSAYENYLSAIDQDLKQSQSKKLGEHEVDYEAPVFELFTLNGEKVALSALKGKIVILDFWATWCGPCIASFPAMQKTVNLYKDRDDVVFLFINSWESTNIAEERMNKVKQFFKEKPYDFTVLIDPKHGTSQSDYEVISRYKVKGIPAKFIINKDGRVRYSLTGFAGGDDLTIAEIRVAVSRLLAE